MAKPGGTFLSFPPSLSVSLSPCLPPFLITKAVAGAACLVWGLRGSPFPFPACRNLSPPPTPRGAETNPSSSLGVIDYSSFAQPCANNGLPSGAAPGGWRCGQTLTQPGARLRQMEFIFMILGYLFRKFPTWKSRSWFCSAASP